MTELNASENRNTDCSYNLRRCEVMLDQTTDLFKGYFHAWITIDEQRVSTRKNDAGATLTVRVPRAIVEFEDGSVGLVKISNIKFI